MGEWHKAEVRDLRGKDYELYDDPSVTNVAPDPDLKDANYQM